MAQTTPVSRTLQIQVQSGIADDGQPKVANHNYANVATDAADDDLLAVGQAVAALYAEPLVQITRIDEVAISGDTANSNA